MMQETAMRFDEDYLIDLLTLSLRDLNFLNVVRSHLKDEYFPIPELREIWKNILIEFAALDYKSLPNISIIKMNFRRKSEILEWVLKIKENHVKNIDRIVNHFEEFIKRNMFVNYYKEIGELYSKGNINESFDKFYDLSKKLNDFSLKSNTFQRLFDDFESRQFQRKLDKSKEEEIFIPFGIDELDHITKGGARLGDVICFLGDSGSGKSFILTHLGVTAARFGHKVLHFQAEGTKKQCYDRYDACWTGTNYYNMKDGDVHEKNAKAIKKILDSKIRGEVFIDVFEKFGSKNTVYVRKCLMEMKRKHSDLNVVIIDYLELLDPSDSKNYSVEFEKQRQQKVAREIKNLAVEFNVVIWTATQASSISLAQLNDSDFVISRYNLAEDKGKVRPLDGLLSINQTKQEKYDKVARIYIDKFREHPGNKVITVAQNLKYSRFYDAERTRREFYSPVDSDD